MKLFDLVKDRLKEPEGVISDNEILVTNRRDFLFSETSTTGSFLQLFNAKNVTYEMYSIIDFLHASICKVRSPTEIRVYQLSQSMTLCSLAVSVLAGDLVSSVRIYSPRGTQSINAKNSFAEELKLRFNAQLSSDLVMSDIGSSENALDILFCNASNEAEVSSGLKSFERARRGLILIKGYGRSKAPNCGEIILSARLNVHCSLAGFGFCIAL